MNQLTPSRTAVRKQPIRSNRLTTLENRGNNVTPISNHERYAYIKPQASPVERFIKAVRKHPNITGFIALSALSLYTLGQADQREANRIKPYSGCEVSSEGLSKPQALELLKNPNNDKVTTAYIGNITPGSLALLAVNGLNHNGQGSIGVEKGSTTCLTEAIDAISDLNYLPSVDNLNDFQKVVPRNATLIVPKSVEPVR